MSKKYVKQIPRQGTGLQGQAVFRTKLSFRYYLLHILLILLLLLRSISTSLFSPFFSSSSSLLLPPRPHSTDSQTHKKMTLSMADRSSKTNQIKVGFVLKKYNIYFIYLFSGDLHGRCGPGLEPVAADEEGGVQPEGVPQE